MTRTTVLYRRAAMALWLLVVAATSGCAHFHDAEVRAQERADAQHAGPLPAEAAPPPLRAPAPVAAAPAPEVAAPAPPVPAPSTPRAPVPPSPAASPPAPATDNAIIIFANTPAANCQTCDTLKISVAPSGQVLMERGSWTAGHGNWRYRRSRADIRPERAAAFAARLSADRPVGAQALGNGGCAAPATGDAGLSIEWIEADRHDLLTVEFGCPAGAGGQTAERLRHAPDLLGLRQLDFP